MMSRILLSRQIRFPSPFLQFSFFFFFLLELQKVTDGSILIEQNQRFFIYFLLQMSQYNTGDFHNLISMKVESNPFLFFINLSYLKYKHTIPTKRHVKI